MKSNDPLGAHRAFTEAVKLDDKNKKYRRSLLEAGRLVSESGFRQAQSQLSSSPQAAFDGFKSALYFDSENNKAAEALAALEAEVGEANLRGAQRNRGQKEETQSRQSLHREFSCVRGSSNDTGVQRRAAFGASAARMKWTPTRDLNGIEVPKS